MVSCCCKYSSGKDLVRLGMEVVSERWREGACEEFDTVISLSQSQMVMS